MGKTITEWEKEIATLFKERRERLADAITTLGNWDFFVSEFEWTGIFTIGKFLRRGKHMEKSWMKRKKTCSGCHCATTEGTGNEFRTAFEILKEKQKSIN